MHQGGATALRAVPSPSLSLQLGSSSLVAPVHVSLKTAFPSLTKHKRPESLPFNMDLADGFLILQINVILSITHEILQRADPWVPCRFVNVLLSNMVWRRPLAQWEEVSTSGSWLELIPISDQEEKSGKHTLLNCEWRKEALFLSFLQPPHAN